ncbi:hypothetical protein QE152_g29853 [Popillia japonica]|uniref:Uncharacterized protein n=1 Tax=Popillia japonica TaxID=7064 RepID=A0AAW1JGR5_POPJA
MKEFCSFINLAQCNTILNNDGKLLDLVFTNLECNIDACDSPSVTEDKFYPSLAVSFSFVKDAQVNFPENAHDLKYNFRKANFGELYEELLRIDWSALEQCTDVDVACDTMYNML